MKNKETREDDWWQVGRTWDEDSEYNLTMSDRWAYVWCHGWGVNCCSMVEVEEPIYVQVPQK